MTIFDELAKLALRFRSMQAVDAYTDPGDLMELVELALRFVPRAEDLCPSPKCQGKIDEFEQVRACALQLQYYLRKWQAHSILVSFTQSSPDESEIARTYAALRDSCRNVCVFHNSILSEWWDFTTSHA